jgi:uncharacterized membrane protein
MTETKYRSLIKAISWRITGSIDTFIVSWIITGKPLMAGSIASVEVVTKIALYWAHERVWNKIQIGIVSNGSVN